MNNTNNLSYKNFIRKFFPSSFTDNVMNALETVFRNNSDTRVINENRKLINQVFNQNLSDAVNRDLAVSYEKDLDYNEVLNKTELENISKSNQKNININLSNSLKNNPKNIIVDLTNNRTTLQCLNYVKNAKSIDEISGMTILGNFDYLPYKKYVSNINDKNPLVIKNKHLYTILNEEGVVKGSNANYHNLSTSQFYDAILSEDVIGVFKKGDSYSFLKNVRDNDNNFILCALKETSEQNYLLSTYGKKFEKEFLNNNEPIYMVDGLKDYIEKGDSHFLVQFQGSLSPKEEISSFINNKIEQNKEKINTEDLTHDENNSKKYSKSNVLELSKNEVKDLANKKEGEVITYKSATDFVNSFNSIGEVLEDRFNIKLNRSDNAIADLFNDTNIQNSEVAVENLFKNTLVDYNDTQISLDTYLNNLGFKTNDLKTYLIEALKDKTKLSKESEFVNKLVNELNNAHNKILENRQHLKNYKKITSKVKNLVELIDKNKKPSAYGDINIDEISALRNFVSGRYSLVDDGLSGTLRKKAYELNAKGYLDKIENSILKMSKLIIRLMKDHLIIGFLF